MTVQSPKSKIRKEGRRVLAEIEREHLAADERQPEPPRSTVGLCADCGEPVERPRREVLGATLCARCDAEVSLAGMEPTARAIERLPVILPEETRCSAEIRVGEVATDHWAWGYRFTWSPEGQGRPSETIEPCRVLDDSHSRAAAMARAARALAMRVASIWAPEPARDKLSEHAKNLEALLPPGDGHASREAAVHGAPSDWKEIVHSAHAPLPPGDTSTVTPAGIAEHDPDALPPGVDGTFGPQGLRKPAGSWHLTIDPEFRAAQRPLSADERERLQASLGKHGCRDPIVVWHDAGVDPHPKTGAPERVRPPRTFVIDGHNRYELCEELHLPFAIVRVRLPDRAAVLEWIRNNQLARRNLTPQERDDLLAREYRAEVQARKRQKNEGRKNGAHVEPQATTPTPAAPHGAAVNAADRRMNKHGVYTKGSKKVNVPLPSTSRCTALIRLVEQLDGTWIYGHSWNRSGSTPGCGGESSLPRDADAFATRLDALRDAGKNLLRYAQRSTSGPWPANAIKAIKEWQALPQNGGQQKASEVVAKKHGVSPATVKRADQRVRARESGQPLSKRPKRPKQQHELRREAQRHIERYLDTLDAPEAWQQSDYLLDALNQWRGRHKPAGKAKRKPR